MTVESEYAGSPGLTLKSKPFWLIAVVIFIGALFFFSVPFSERPFATSGESREALVVKSMVTQGNYVLPYRNIDDLPSKPPLFHWLAAGAGKIFGHLSEYSIRFPSAFSSALVLVLLFAIGALQFNKRTGILAALVLASAFEWERTSSLSRVDLVFAATVNLAALIGYLTVSFTGEARLRERWEVAGFGAAVALAVLAKGPAGLVLPAVAIAFFLLYRWKTGHGFSLSNVKVLLAGAAVGLVISGIWYYAAYRIGGSQFLDVHFMRENIARLTHTDGYPIGHRKPFYFSFLHLCIGFLPWTFLLPALLLKFRGSDPFRARFTPQQRDILTFAAIWVGTVLLAATLSWSKRPVYLIPAFPALALLLSVMIDSWKEPLEGTLGWRTWRALFMIFAAVFTGAGAFLVAFLFVKGDPGLFCRGDKFISSLCLSAIPPLLASPFLSAGLLAAGVMFFRAARALPGSGAVSVRYLALALIAIFFVGSRAIEPALSQATSPRDFVQMALAKAGNAPIFQFRSDVWGVLFYSDRAIPMARDFQALPPDNTVFVLTREPDLEKARAGFDKSEVVLVSERPVADGRHFMVLFKGTK